MELLVEEDVERKEILRQYRKLLRTAKPYLKDDDAKIIKKAFNTSLEAHKDMRRKSGEPYIVHPLAVAQIVVEEMGLGTTAIVSALLHDVVEDTEMEISDIEKHFGPKVAKIIDGLTKISGVFEKSGSLQAENFRKLILTLSDDVRVILIKIADRLHNMRTLDSMPRDKQLKIASETIYLYAPLAHRLGLYPIKSELEDHYLKYTDPIVYKGIALKLKQTKAARNKFIKDFTEPIERELGKAGFDFIVKGRPKSIYSIWNKIKKQNIHFEDIYDLFAIRIIIKTPVESEKSGCWRVYSLVTDIYKPNPDRLRDWISTPRSNGYESLHTTVMSKAGQWVEVQIRSERMDEIAEKGYAAHWKYKDTPSAQGSEKGIELWFSKIRDMLSNTTRKGSLDFVDEFKSNLFSEEVFVFTPKGELRVLPNGATALDFAFEIHTQIGAKCLGAKVNQKLVPLSYVMNNGDQIEILTSTKQHPNEDWLNFVTTSKARAKIKDYLKEEVRKVALEGKEMVERRFRNLKIEFNNDNVNRLANIFHEKTSQDLYYKVAKGQIDLKNVRDLSDPKDEKQTTVAKIEKSDVKKVIEFEPTSKKSPFNELLFGDNREKLDYTLAKCCNPIPGDDVFGFVTINEGIKIHRTTCPNAIELGSHYGYRILKAKWVSQNEIAFLTGLTIKGADKVGMASDITRIISNEYKVNMRSVNFETDDGTFDGKIMLYVHDTNELEKLIKKLNKVPGVISVSRHDS